MQLIKIGVMEYYQIHINVLGIKENVMHLLLVLTIQSRNHKNVLKNGSVLMVDLQQVDFTLVQNKIKTMQMKNRKLFVLMKKMKRDVLVYKKMAIIVFGILKLRIALPKVFKNVMMLQIQLQNIVKTHHANGMIPLKSALIYLVIYLKMRVIVIYILTLI